MTRAWRALIAKELHQHGFALVALSIVLVLTLALYWMGYTFQDRVLSSLTVVSHFALLPLSLAALFLGHRLVVVECYGRTQSFVEALPVWPGQMEFVKYALGLGYLCAAGLAALTIVSSSASSQEPVDPSFFLIMSLRLAAFIWCVWSVAFALGMLGRLRILIFVLAMLITIYLEYHTALSLNRFGPLAAIDSYTFGFEREAVPLSALIESALLASAFTVLGFGLAYLREGTVVEQLAKPMSQREKTTVVIVIVAGVILLSHLEGQETVQDFEFTGIEVLRDQDPPLEIAYLNRRYRSKAENVRGHLAPRLAQLWPAIGWTESPLPLRVRLAPRRHPERSSTTWGNREEGVLVEANFSDPVVPPREITSYVVHELLTAHSAGRALFEPKHWLTDGFALYWAEHAMAPAPALGVGFEPVVFEGLLTLARLDVTTTSVREWDRTAEQIGYFAAGRMAYLGLRVLEEQQGREAVLALVREVFSRRAYDDAREWWYERSHPMSRVFKTATNRDWSEFVRTWHKRVHELGDSPTYLGPLGKLPRLEARLETISNGAAYDLSYEVELVEPATVSPVSCELLHAPLFPVDAPVDRRSLNVEEKAWAAGEPRLTYTLGRAYVAGTRVMVVVECRFQGISGPLRLAVRRVELP